MRHDGVNLIGRAAAGSFIVWVNRGFRRRSRSRKAGGINFKTILSIVEIQALSLQPHIHFQPCAVQKLCLLRIVQRGSTNLNERN